MAKNQARSFQNPVYDQHAKRLLSQKAIMARLLKRTVPEFEDVDINDIAERYIEGTPRISELPVDRDKTNTAQSSLRPPKEIFGDATESIGITEGWIRFDILFHAHAPRSGERITLIINVEAQRTQRRSKLGYAILRRAVYYASRLISSQKETEFAGSSYDEIKKVYTIWLCLDAPHGKSAINRYDLAEHHILHHHKEDRADYDLMSIVTIYLGEEQGHDEDWLIRFLRLLFKDTLTPPTEKKRLLKDEFDMDTSTDMEEELRTMCNLSTRIYEQGMERGMERGMEQGMERGMKRGMEQGMERGREEGKVDIVLEMLRNNLPLETIATVSRFSLDKVKELGRMHSLL